MPSDFYEKLTYEKEKKAVLEVQALDRKEFLQGSEEAKRDFVKQAKKQDMDPIEIEEKLKAMEEGQKRQLNELLEKQQRKMDELELRHLGPPSERQR
jgi:hypothetical protein